MDPSMARERARSYSHHDNELAKVSNELWRAFRDDLRVAHSEQHGGFHILTRYEDICTAAREPGRFSSIGRAIPPVPVNFLPIYLDPPQHTAYRRLLNLHLGLQPTATREPVVRAIAHRLMQALQNSDEFDFIASFAGPFPQHVALDLIGIPPDEAPQMVGWVVDILKLRGIDDDRVRSSAEMIKARIGRLVEQHRQDPQPDSIVSGLVASTVDGEPLTDDALVGMISLVLFGGLDTSTTSLASCVLHLIEHPEMWEEVRSDSTRIPRAVDEMLRHTSPVQQTARTATRDDEVGGCPIRAGDRVLLVWASGNRDERRFEDPDSVKLDRSPNPHLAFGYGPHRCAGAPLAELMMRIGLEEMLIHIDGAEVIQPELKWRAGESKYLPELWLRRTPS